MKAIYEKQDDLLYLSYGVRAKDGASLEDDPGVMLDLGADGGCDIVALTIMGASSWFDKGYDEVSDKWLIGSTTDVPGMVTVNGDFVGYWQPDRYDLDEVPDPIGVEIRHVTKNVSEHIHKALLDACQTAEASLKEPVRPELAEVLTTNGNTLTS